MTEATKDVVKAFDALSPSEQKQVLNEITRRSAVAEDLPEAALHDMAVELFRGYEEHEKDFYL